MSLQDVVSNLRAEVETSVDSKPMVKVHAKEWEKVRRETEPPRRRAAETPSGRATTDTRLTRLTRLTRTTHPSPQIMQGKPVEINPSIGHGFKIMSVDEWAARWKHNDDPVFADCLNCGGKNTKEHAFTQTWCRGKKKWDSECLCLDCHMFSRRQYCDPDFKTPEEYEKERWEGLAGGKTTVQA